MGGDQKSQGETGEKMSRGEGRAGLC